MQRRVLKRVSSPFSLFNISMKFVVLPMSKVLEYTVFFTWVEYFDQLCSVCEWPWSLVFQMPSIAKPRTKNFVVSKYFETLKLNKSVCNHSLGPTILLAVRLSPLIDNGDNWQFAYVLLNLTPEVFPVVSEEEGSEREAPSDLHGLWRQSPRARALRRDLSDRTTAKQEEEGAKELSLLCCRRSGELIIDLLIGLIDRLIDKVCSVCPLCSRAV